MVDKDLIELEAYWDKNLSGLKVDSPDENFNNMVNVWNAYQSFITLLGLGQHLHLLWVKEWLWL